MGKYYINWNDEELARPIQINDNVAFADIVNIGLCQYYEDIENTYVQDFDNITEEELNNEIEISIYEGCRIYPRICISRIIEDLVDDQHWSIADYESERIEKEIYGKALNQLRKGLKSSEYFSLINEKEKPIIKDLKDAIKDVFAKHGVDMSTEELNLVKTYKYKFKEIKRIIENESNTSRNNSR